MSDGTNSMQDDNLVSERHEEAIRMRAVKMLERSKEQERLRQEELAYRRWRAERRRFIVGVGPLAVILLIVVCLWLSGLTFKRSSRKLPVASTPPAPRVVATVVNAGGARWEGVGMPPIRGADLVPGPVRFAAGFVELAFEKGVRVIIQAPADVEFVDERGRPGRSPWMQIVSRDPGTTCCTNPVSKGPLSLNGQHRPPCARGRRKRMAACLCSWKARMWRAIVRLR